MISAPVWKTSRDSNRNDCSLLQKDQGDCSWFVGYFKVCMVNTYLSEMLGTTVVCILDFFRFLEYLHIHNEISWGCDPSINTELICVLYTQLEDNFVYETKFIQWAFRKQRCHNLHHVDNLNFPLVVSSQCSKSFGHWSIAHFSFWIRDAQSTLYLNLKKSGPWESLPHVHPTPSLWNASDLVVIPPTYLSHFYAILPTICRTQSLTLLLHT
jgi:hypothetical protein